jgi:hypothetical protein
MKRALYILIWIAWGALAFSVGRFLGTSGRYDDPVLRGLQRQMVEIIAREGANN